MNLTESSKVINSWNWQAYIAKDIPAGLITPQGLPLQKGKLALPDGRLIAPISFKFPDNGIVNLWDYAGKLPSLQRTILVARIPMEKSAPLRLGLGVDWLCNLYMNGQLIFSTEVTGNGESPIRPDNHFVATEGKAGENLLVLEAISGDLSLDIGMMLMPASEKLELRHLPWAHCPDSDRSAMTISFTATLTCPAGVDYRPVGSQEWTRRYDNLGGQIRRDKASHNVRLVNLQPDTLYEARPVLLDEYQNYKEIPQEEAVIQFRTAPAPDKSDFSFVVTSDLQTPSTRHDFLHPLFQTDFMKQASFFAFLGDVIWTTDFNQAVIEEFIQPIRQEIIEAKQGQPMVIVRGNHELYGKDTNRFFEYFSMPYPGHEGYGIWRWGDVCFIQLDFCDDTDRQPSPSTRALHNFDPYLEEESRWLQEVIERPICKEAKYRIVLAHAIPLGDFREYMPGHVRTMIDPLFAGENPRCKIHLWLGGHVHYGFRSIPGTNQYRCTVNIEDFLPQLKQPRIGDRYHFPVLVCSGPRAGVAAHLEYSSMEIRISSQNLTVISRDYNHEEFDRIVLNSQGEVIEEKSSDFFKLKEYRGY